MTSKPISIPHKIIGVGVLWNAQQQILIDRRRPEGAMGGLWEFPGGKVEPGETPQEALARELREELMIEARVGEFLTATVHDVGATIIELSTYECEFVAGSLVLTEHAESRWVNIAELADLDWAPADIPTVKLLQERFV